LNQLQSLNKHKWQSNQQLLNRTSKLVGNFCSSFALLIGQEGYTDKRQLTSSQNGTTKSTAQSVILLHQKNVFLALSRWQS